jgi:hypothetical protein
VEIVQELLQAQAELDIHGLQQVQLMLLVAEELRFQFMELQILQQVAVVVVAMVAQVVLDLLA